MSADFRPANRATYNNAPPEADDDDWDTDPDSTSVVPPPPPTQFVTMTQLRDQVLQEDKSAKANSSVGKQASDRKAQYQKPLNC
ncbi:hypothetical protein Pelo_8516 [Pelomyxa schiedti]|nr:hypothetical protein Pelo_8516 [Pelomyxa schiedti]